MERLCTLITANLLDLLRGRICSKASAKHLESRLEVIRGHIFWDHWKADKAYCIIM